MGRQQIVLNTITLKTPGKLKKINTKPNLCYSFPGHEVFVLVQ